MYLQASGSFGWFRSAAARPRCRYPGVPARPRARRTGGEEAGGPRRSVCPSSRAGARRRGRQRGGGAGPQRPPPHWSQLRPPPGFQAHSRLSGPRARRGAAGNRWLQNSRLREERTVGWTERRPRGARAPPDRVRVTPGRRAGSGGSSRSAPRASHLRALRG